MRCDEYRELLFERLAGELAPEQELNCTAHEASCVVCRAELAEFRSVSQKLRAGWPSEDVMPLSVGLPPAGNRNWLDVAGTWFARASAVTVMACLLALVLVRPAVHLDRGGIQFAFDRAPQTAAVAGVSEQQVKALVQAAVDQRAAHAQPAALPEKKAEDGRVVQVAMQVQQLQQSQANLWQAVQQHNIYLESRGAARRPTRGRPA